ncbi:hypothetical protein BC937DRAFT_87941 [Endogone sp. FLAS-F59071]|nr:hypothetical protein BC937DRAFT_87941 [Endogone sp. FLAS-F59071]|eukprot:RUS19145.1 hypothetical protein BC937DRAFT_87941 [Endogone sp. FLAS-F59071]
MYALDRYVDIFPYPKFQMAIHPTLGGAGMWGVKMKRGGQVHLIDLVPIFTYYIFGIANWKNTSLFPPQGFYQNLSWQTKTDSSKHITALLVQNDNSHRFVMLTTSHGYTLQAIEVSQHGELNDNKPTGVLGLRRGHVF